MEGLRSISNCRLFVLNSNKCIFLNIKTPFSSFLSFRWWSDHKETKKLSRYICELLLLTLHSALPLPSPPQLVGCPRSQDLISTLHPPSSVSWQRPCHLSDFFNSYCLFFPLNLTVLPFSTPHPFYSSSRFLISLLPSPVVLQPDR